MWRGQHEDFGDDSVRKTVNQIDIEGDDRFALTWYPDRIAVNQANARPTLPRGPVPDSQNTDLQSWRVKLEKAQCRWIKLEIRLNGDYNLLDKYPAREEEEMIARPMYGGIFKMRIYTGVGQNRP